MIHSNGPHWTTLCDLSTKNISTKFQHNLRDCLGEEVKNGKNAQKFIKKYKKIAAPPVEQIKVWGFPVVSQCNFKAIGLALLEEKIF